MKKMWCGNSPPTTEFAPLIVHQGIMSNQSSRTHSELSERHVGITMVRNFEQLPKRVGVFL